MIFKAIKFATDAHSGQYRKGTKVPYLVHPLGVGRLLIEAGAPEAVVVAGILHDTVEDAGVTVEQLRSEFGDEVAALVAEVSEPPKSEMPWEGRKRELLRRMAVAALPMVLVEAADKLDNLCSIRSDLRLVGDEVWKRFNRPRDRQHWYYASMARALQARSESAAVAALARRLADEVEQVFGGGPAPEPPDTAEPPN